MSVLNPTVTRNHLQKKEHWTIKPSPYLPFRSWVSLAKSPHLCDPRCPPLWEEKGASDDL